MATQTLLKQPGENRLYSMEFAALLAEGETLSNVLSVSISPSGLTTSGSPSYSGTIAQQRLYGGTAGVLYKVTFTVTTSQSNTLQGEGYLQVKDL